MTYTSYSELLGNTVKFNDFIVFIINNNIYHYNVSENYLCNLNKLYDNGNIANNDIIFKILNIKDKYKFCSKAYGYDTYYGDFPVFKALDFKALTKLILEIFKLCDNYIDVNSNIWD